MCPFSNIICFYYSYIRVSTPDIKLDAVLWKPEATKTAARLRDLMMRAHSPRGAGEEEASKKEKPAHRKPRVSDDVSTMRGGHSDYRYIPYSYFILYTKMIVYILE